MATLAIVAASAGLSCDRSTGDDAKPGGAAGTSQAKGGGGGVATAGGSPGGTPTGGAGGRPSGGSSGRGGRASGLGGGHAGASAGGSGGSGKGGDSGEAGAHGGAPSFEFDCFCTTCTAPFEYCHVSFIDEDAPSHSLEVSCQPIPTSCDPDYSCGCIYLPASRNDVVATCSARVQSVPGPECSGDAQTGVTVWDAGP